MKEKEIKTFFNNHNRLNKGYSRVNSPREVDGNSYKKPLENVLPPIELMNEYEAMYPGTAEKLMKMATKEQEHRHATELKSIDMAKAADKMNRIFALISITIICTTALALGTFAGTIGLVIAGSLLIAIGVLTALNLPRRRPIRHDQSKFNNNRLKGPNPNRRTNN